MRPPWLLFAFCVAVLFGCISTARSYTYLNETKEEKPRKKKKVKGFDYEKSRYISKATGIGGEYVYNENGEPSGQATKKKKGRKAKPKEDADGDGSSSPASLGETKPKAAFHKMDSFSDGDKSKTGGMTPEQAMQAAKSAQNQASQAQGQGAGSWNNFQPQTGPQSGGAGQVKVMP